MNKSIIEISQEIRDWAEFSDKHTPSTKRLLLVWADELAKFALPAQAVKLPEHKRHDKYCHYIVYDGICNCGANDFNACLEQVKMMNGIKE